jgi:actin
MQGWGEKVVVIDNGSDSTKAGFAGYDAPQVIFQTVMCRLPSSSEQEKKQQGIGLQRPKCYFGREALVVGKDAKVKVKFPVENGLVTNWDDMEQVIEFLNVSN